MNEATGQTPAAMTQSATAQPAESSWRMPAETAPHERIWMAFPRPPRDGSDDFSDDTYAAWAAVANATVDFEPVTMLVDPAARERADALLDDRIDVVAAELDDCWMRDFGPTFVLDPDGALGAVDWIFNGWGAQEWASWDHDVEIARTVAGLATAPVVSSMLVNEGGGIHVDGEGTVLVTETVQLDAGRNPYADKARVEAELARTIGATHVVWLPRGLTRDYDGLGTRGHVDIVATIPSPGTILLHAQPNPEHPDHAVMREVRTVLEASRDAAGREWNIIDLPAPATLRDEEGWVDYSYVNHLVVNGGVIACGFGELEADARAADILAQAYPGRRVVTIDARLIYAQGGGIHCITQQQPESAR